MKKIANNIQESKENLNSLFLIRKSSNKSFLIMLFVILISSLSSSAQQCSFQLSTTDNIESVNNEGRTYFVQLQNNSSDGISINLAVSNSNADINPDKTSSANNVNLLATILSEDGQTVINTIQLQPNQILKLQVKVTVPAGTSIEHWNSMLLKASSDLCADYSSSLILYTFIPNPNEN